MRRVVAAVIVAMTVAACGNVAEGIAERAIEADSGGDVHVDLDSGDGSVSVEYDDESGGGSATFGGGEVPDGFPLPVPEGGTIIQVIESDGDQVVSAQYPVDEYDSLVEVYTRFFADFADTQTSTGSGEMAFYTATSTEAGLSVSLSATPDVVLATLAYQP